MTYLREIDELYDKRWKEAKARSEQFFNTYFVSTEVNPPSIEPEQIPEQETAQGGWAEVQETPRPRPSNSNRGFTPAEREAFVNRMKANGHVVMTADGLIDPSSTRTKQVHGSFRRANTGKPAPGGRGVSA